MNRYLSHTSALEWLAYAKADPLAPAAADRRERLPRHDGTPLPPAGKTTRADIDGLASFGLGYLAKPVHLLVPSSECRIRCADARCHVRSGPFPARSFLPIDEGTFSSSPELAFVQMAEVLDCPRLVKLGDELCGIYGIETVGIVDFDRTSPFTTVKRLERFLLKAECMPGLVKARKAVRHIAPGSASPMETAIVLLFCLPPRLGGYGLPRPVMNGGRASRSKPAASPPTDATVATSCGRPPTSPWNTTASCITAAARRWPTTQEEGTTCWREAPRWYRSRAEQCGTSSNSTRSHGFLQGAWANGFPRTESAGEKPSTSFTGC